MSQKKDKSIRMTLPQVRTLHGVKIVKLPVARYTKALDTLENLPHIVVNAVLPEVGGFPNCLTTITMMSLLP